MLNKLLGMPLNASEHGFQVDQMLEFVHWIMLVLFVGWSTFFIFTLIRFHKSRNPKADYHGVKSKASTHIEFMVVLVESVFLLGFGIPLWGKRVNGPKPEGGDVERVRVVAEQYKWNFHYPGADGVIGRRKTELVSASNPVGLDYTDPAAKDDIVTANEMHLPVNKDVILEISSKDVIHSLSLQFMRIGQDATPGLVSPIWFKPVRTGEFEIICGQLCGYGHYLMRGNMVIDSAEDYQAWLKEKAANAGAPAAPAAGAATPAPAAPPAGAAH